MIASTKLITNVGAAMLLACCSSCSVAAEDKATHVEAEAASELVSNKTVVVLDIRTPKEFAAGHIAGATNIDFRSADFEKELDTLDKSKSYLVHCASGGRSSKALPVLERYGFKSVYHLDHGIKGWQKAGLPTEK